MVLESVFRASESTATCTNQKQTALTVARALFRSLRFLHLLCSIFFVEQENDQQVDSRRGRTEFMFTEYLWATKQAELCTFHLISSHRHSHSVKWGLSTDEITEIPGVRGTCPGSQHKWQTEAKFSLSLAPKPWVLALSHMFCFPSPNYLPPDLTDVRHTRHLWEIC